MPSDPPNYLRRRILVLLLALFILIVGIGVPVAVLGPLPGARAAADVAGAAHATTKRAALDLPSFGSSAVALVERDGLLGTAGSQAPKQMASITKLVTALTVLQRRPLHGSAAGPTIRFTAADEAILQDVLAHDGSWEAVQAGWTLTERQTLQTMLIPSANNYARSLADWAFGSEQQYLTAARAYLKAHHLTHTTIVSPDGLDPGNRSTPADLIALGRLALKSSVVTSIVRQAEVTEPHLGLIENTNALIGHSTLSGIKTGTTEAGRANLLFSAPVTVHGQRLEVIGVIMDANSHDQLDAAVAPLLASVRAGLHVITLARAHQVFAHYRTAWGGVAAAVASKSVSRVVWSKEDVRGTPTLEPIRGGLQGDRVGTVSYRLGGRTIEVPLELDRSLLVAPVWWRLTHPVR